MALYFYRSTGYNLKTVFNDIVNTSFHACSGMSDDVILQGRPYGGVAILWSSICLIISLRLIIILVIVVVLLKLKWVSLLVHLFMYIYL